MTQAPDEAIKIKLESLKAGALGRDLEESLNEARKLRQNAERAMLLEEVVRFAKDGVIITEAAQLDGAGPKIIFVNEAFSKISGYSSEEVLGKTPRMLQGANTDRDTLRDLRAALEKKEPFQGEIINYNKSGAEYWLDISIVPIHDAHGNVTHFAAIERDITERKKAEQELTEAKETAEKAQKKAEDIAQFPLHSPDPLLKIDFAKESLLFVNPAAYNKYSDILRKGLTHPLLKDVVEAAQQSFMERKPVTREITVGNVVYQQVITSNFLASEQTATVYCYNITKLKHVEETLREESAKAEMANRAKSDFLANMSHELRTPMNGVLGMAGLLKDTVLTPEQKELVNTIFLSGESLLMLLNDILDLSKIEAGQLTLEDIPFNLNTTIHETARLLDPLAKKKGLNFYNYYNPATPDCVVGDPARIRQVITNLMGNALKFTESGYVKLDITSRRMSDGRHELFFRIDDTGIGIQEKNLNKIFQKFSQADESTTRRFGGTGLGLTICKLLVEAMGGKIGVESVVGKGSSFWFTLPLYAASAEQTARLQKENRTLVKEDAAALAHFAEKRIIVVDDHPVNLFFAKKLLTKFGFKTVDTAEDGKTALQMVARGRYDMIITDCQMPEMDGYEVSMAIRASEQGTGKRIPIIAMTANAMVGDREKCLSAGMDDYVSKPIDGNKLLEILMKWLGSCPLPNEQTQADTEDMMIEKSAAPEAEAPVDMDHLRQYIGEDEEEKKMVIEMFTSGATESLAIMEAHANEGEDLSWKKAAHKLKGSAANFGARALSSACKQAEDQYGATQSDKQKLLLLVNTAYTDVRDFLARI